VKHVFPNPPVPLPRKSRGMHVSKCSYA